MGDPVWGAERQSTGGVRGVSSGREGQHRAWEILIQKD